MRFALVLLLLISIGCKQVKTESAVSSSDRIENKVEAITLLGDTLRTPVVTEGKAKENYQSAKQHYLENENDPESLIWYGRRAGYVGQFQKAIEIFSEGIEKFPDDARFLRHRGHRYISTRQYDLAIMDFESAAKLVEGLPEQIEPDGLPNSRNVPLSTLQSNIWYHLGLAYYLKGDMPNALKAYQNRTVTNRYDDNLVSGGHWLYMIFNRLEKPIEAERAIKEIHKEMDVIENTSYYNMCLFYKGVLNEDELEIETVGTSSNDVYLYGLGNWYLYNKKDTTTAKSLYKKLLEEGNSYSFAYLAAESDWKRFFAN
ncbi:tetratricopeptide repeat protein [Croceivirga thetidis]|uniref:Tetratricopeptide repeat protein n=1 Tax=Croceivirga thetidis TaxID=2721623 RepID=A0ABX1GVT6_9FLAO|nr:tetratricopeptide repeat protein [Croceivirga thetidis]NKI32847.1 tetratricopeptide repeat protein [Croceivirga thetidis]